MGFIKKNKISVLALVLLVGGAVVYKNMPTPSPFPKKGTVMTLVNLPSEALKEVYMGCEATFVGGQELHGENLAFVILDNCLNFPEEVQPLPDIISMRYLRVKTEE